MSSIGRGTASAQITNIQRLSTDGAKVIGQTGRTNMEDGPTEYYFVLDLATGTLNKFATQAELSSTMGTAKPLRRPEELYNAEINRERSGLFWPLVCFSPVGLAASLFSVSRFRRNRTTPGPLNKLDAEVNPAKRVFGNFVWLGQKRRHYRKPDFADFSICNRIRKVYQNPNMSCQQR